MFGFPQTIAIWGSATAKRVPALAANAYTKGKEKAGLNPVQVQGWLARPFTTSRTGHRAWQRDYGLEQV